MVFIRPFHPISALLILLQVTLKTGQAVIVYKTESGLSEDALSEVVDDLGFRARPLPADSYLPNPIPMKRNTLACSSVIIQNPPSDWSTISEVLVNIPGVLISRGDSEKGILNVWHVSSMISTSG